MVWRINFEFCFQCVGIAGWARTSVLEYYWHPAQQIIEQADDHVTVTFLRQHHRIKRWLLVFGCHAAVLKPTALVKEIQQELAAMGQLYEGE
ncbi:MAG: WYL domain-containing protein [Phycisphaeraceae bacterium JB051]